MKNKKTAIKFDDGCANRNFVSFIFCLQRRIKAEDRTQLQDVNLRTVTAVKPLKSII